MQIQINGESQTLDDSINITELLDRLDMQGRRIAVERNGEIVPRAEHATTRLVDGDRLEIVHAIGGGQPDA